jgi:hypothetical protein
VQVSARNTSQCFVCGSQPAGAAHYAGPDECTVRDQCEDGDLANQLKVRELGVPVSCECEDAQQ